ncbi:MAG: carboxypeptidase-like regulatory domain-containing protein [Planctomycetes bacterium]|nr:carboxypeptidase-like regulatory domain-containing protein [Planctomycetota bacterium]
MPVPRPWQRALLLTGLAMLPMVWWWLRHDAAPPRPEAMPAPPPVAQSTIEIGSPHPGGADEPLALTPQRTPVPTTAPQLRGRLVQGDQALANVQLRLHQWADYMPVATDHTVTTAADGTFATSGLASAFRLRAETASVPLDWESPVQSPLTCDRDLGDLRAPLALALDLVVADAAGQPVPQPRCWWSRTEVEVRLDARDTRAPRLVVGDERGRIRLDRLMPGPLHLKVAADGFAMVEKEIELEPIATTSPMSLTLSRGRRVLGRVFDWRDQPLPGAIVSAEGRQVATDATGAFAFDAYGGAEPIHIAAPGHQGCWPGWLRGSQADYSHIRLERALTLRGVVRGGNAATWVVLDAAPQLPSGVPWPGPREQLERLHAVAADGTFAIEGLVASDFVVHARAEGLGSSVGQRVAMREDVEVELAVDPLAAIALRVVDAAGRAIDPVEVVCDRQIVEYPELFGPYGKDIPERVFDDQGRVALSATGGAVRVPAAADQPLALGVRSAGFLPEIRTFGVGEAPSELTIVLQRGGSVRGSLRRDGERDYSLAVAIWPVAQDDAVRSGTAKATLLDVDAGGRFASGTLPPGDYCAAVNRYGRGRIANRSDEHPGAVPLVDDGLELRAVTRFAVTAGSITSIELAEPSLGMLRGRVLYEGRTIAGAWVVAARPGATQFGGRVGGGEAIDWDSDIDLQYVAGQRSGDDGSFRFRYRDPGPVELRVRHANGAATSQPTVLVLPAPELGMECTLLVGAGAIRGRFVVEDRSGERRGPLQAVLYPLHKASGDPGYATDHTDPLSWSCTKVALAEDGRFAFDCLPPGDWLVRIEPPAFAGSAGPLWQRVVNVQGEGVELGDLRPDAGVAASVRWRWPAGDKTVRSVRGVWIYSPHREDARAVWVGTFAALDGTAELRVPPGRYTIEPFGNEGEYVPLSGGWGLSGSRLAQPIAIEVHEDGSMTPAELTWTPLPPGARCTRMAA